jgi:glycosyltransferase involved in cell wall biosynthesis
MRILVVNDHFVPAYKAGGAVRTLANLVEQLGDRFAFRVITGDRDLGDPGPFPDLPINVWSRAQHCEIIYLPPELLYSAATLRRIIRDTPHDLIYLNSFFSGCSIRILALRRSGLIPRSPILIAPRGELMEGALANKPRKKGFFIGLARAVGLYSGLSWQASNELEAQSISTLFRSRVITAADVPERASPPPTPRLKRPGHCSFVFYSRITPKKNLHFAIDLLRDVPGVVRLDVIGPEEDAAYARRCRGVAETLPPNVVCRFLGPIRPEDAHATLSEYHFFLFPTLGENFGHVILEALMAGCPAVLSDRTPWSGLREQDAGWDVPIENRQAFIEVVGECVAMDDNLYQVLGRGARRLAVETVEAESIVEANTVMFQTAAAEGG